MVISSLQIGFLVRNLSCGAVVTGGVEHLSCMSGNMERDRDRGGLFLVLSGRVSLYLTLVFCLDCFFIFDTVKQRSLERCAVSYRGSRSSCDIRVGG